MVVVLHPVEGPMHHGVLEVAWRLESGDAGGEALADKEVAGLPGNGVVQSEEAGSGAAGTVAKGDGLFAVMGVTGKVDFDGAG